MHEKEKNYIKAEVCLPYRPGKTPIGAFDTACAEEGKRGEKECEQYRDQKG